MQLISTLNTSFVFLSIGAFFYAGRPPVKTAILATDATAIHYARLHALLTPGSSIKVRVFQDRKEAAQWLGVPIDLLTTEPARAKHPDDQKDQPKKGAP